MESINLPLPIKNKNDIIDTAKLLSYKLCPIIFNSVNFNEDTLFYNPLLFAFFNQEENKETRVLKSILSKGENKNELFINSYFKVIRKSNDLLKPFFFEFNRGKITNSNPNYSMTWRNNYLKAEKALQIIQNHLPNYYKELVFSNNTLFFHDNIKIINFVTKKSQGLLYFNTLPENDEVYFIEEFIHQGSHNFFNLYLHNKKKWSVDEYLILKPMSELTGNKKDYRSFFSMFHGLYTVSKRVDCFHVLLTKKVFKGKQKHELLGRMTDQYIRFFRGRYDNKIDLERILTKKGINLYKMLFNKSNSILENYHNLPKRFDLSNRDVDFRYSDFCKLNPIEKFDENY